MSHHSVDVLIRDLIATRRVASAQEVKQIQARIGRATFNRSIVNVPGKQRNVTYLGRTIQPQDDSYFVHLVKHVVVEKQWAYGTTARSYLRDLHEAA